MYSEKQTKPNNLFVPLLYQFSDLLYNNQINARALIGQSAVGYCAGDPRKNHASSELLYKSNRPQVSMVYKKNSKNS